MRLSERNEAISPPSLTPPSPSLLKRGIRGGVEGEGGVGGVSVKREDGLTLIEIILTIIVISVGVLGLVSAISFTMGKGINAEVVSTAQALAQERMEELLAKKRDAGYAATPDLDIGTTTTALPSPFSGYTRIVEICNVDNNLGNQDCTAPDNGSGFKRITVNITYSGLPDLPSPVASLVSVIANVRE